MRTCRLICWLMGHDLYRVVSFKTTPPSSYPARCVRCGLIQKERGDQKDD